MSAQNGTEFDQLLSDNNRISTALASAGREAALTHARLGRTVPAWKDGKVVWLTPEEVFASYGLDENGKPKPQPT